MNIYSSTQQSNRTVRDSAKQRVVTSALGRIICISVLACTLFVITTQSYAQKRYTCESATPLQDFDRKMRLVLTVPDKKVLGDARLTLALIDRDRQSTEHLSDPLRTAAGTLNVQLGSLKPYSYPFVVLDYSSNAVPNDASNSLRGLAIDKQTSTVLILSIFNGKDGLEFVAFDQLLAPINLVRGKCSAT
jgi:hypothetical protein